MSGELSEVPWGQIGKAFGIESVPTSITLLRVNGFSGTKLWRVQPGYQPEALTVGSGRTGALILRRMPPVNEARLLEIHAVIQHVAANGCEFVPVALETIYGSCCEFVAGRNWQLEPEISGIPNYLQEPSPERLQNALMALARWHLAASTFDEVTAASAAPGIQARLTRCQALAKPGGILDKLAGATNPQSFLHRFVTPFLTAFQKQKSSLMRELEVASQLEVPVQYCIRDVHHEHILFASATADGVTGIVDFDAVRLDSVAADISRLLRSLTQLGPEHWGDAIANYERIRPLHSSERRLLATYDRVNRLLAGIQWLEWIILERREFDWSRVEIRLKSILSAL